MTEVEIYKNLKDELWKIKDWWNMYGLHYSGGNGFMNLLGKEIRSKILIYVNQQRNIIGNHMPDKDFHIQNILKDIREYSEKLLEMRRQWDTGIFENMIENDIGNQYHLEMQIGMLVDEYIQVSC